MSTMQAEDYADTMTERQLMDAIIDAATRLNWCVCHISDGLYAVAAKHGRHDAMTGAKGFPDIFLAGHGRVLAIECKSATGDLTDEQERWLVELKAAGVTTLVARPRDMDTVIAHLEDQA